MNNWARHFDRNSPSAGPAAGRLAPATNHYFAFLSYSHTDTADADWLHDQLESFRVPSALAGRLAANGVIPRRLKPIFRDRNELPAAADLGAEIRSSLAASQFLIVLCSPAAAKSKWTNAEIEEFKRVRPEGCILAAVIAGEPFAGDMAGQEEQECFPPALRFKYDRRGRRTGKRAEPLAADLRDGRDGRRLGFLKLVAGMLGVGLDELVQRESMRRQRRLAYITAASLAGMAVTSTLALTAIQARDEAREQRAEAEGLVGFMLGDLKDKLEPIGRLDALDAVGSQALAYFEKQEESELSDQALGQHARALTLIGEIANIRGDLGGALKRYTQALASTGESVRRYPEDPQRLFDHAQNVFWVGYIAYQRGQTDQAAASFHEYKRLADQMVTLDPDETAYRLEQVYADNNLGAVLMDKRQYREAAAAFQNSLLIAEQIAASEPRNSQYHVQVANNIAWLAEANEFSGALEQAIAERERQVQLLAELRKREPQDTLLQRDLMTARRALGRLFASRGDVGRGLSEAAIAVGMADALFRIEPQNTEWLQWNAMARFDLGDLQLSAGSPAEAAATIRAGCGIADRLVKRNSTVADWVTTQQLSCLMLQSRLALRQNEAAEALRLATRAVTVAQASPKPTQRGIFVMQATGLGSAALESLGRDQESGRWVRAALRSVPSDVQLKPRELAQLAEIRLRSGDRDGARQLMSRLASIGYRHPDYMKITAGGPGVRGQGRI